MRVEVAEQGLPLEEIVRRLATGWLMFSVMVDRPAIAVPGGPGTGPKRVDVWVEPPEGPTVPQIAVANALRLALEAKGDRDTLEWLSQAMFKTPILELVQQLNAMMAPVDTPIQ